jgi:hypothetical protein
MSGEKVDFVELLFVLLRGTKFIWMLGSQLKARPIGLALCGSPAKCVI